MAKIQILVGTVGGTAWKTAQAVAHVLRHQGHAIAVNDEPRPTDLSDPAEALLVCTSTTGDGELPRNIYPLYLALDDRAIDLAGRHYGIIALGDSGYRRFAHAGFLLEDALYGSGGRRLGQVYTLDARVEDNPPLAAARWAHDWASGLDQATG
jgi:MioC protein